MDGKKMNINTKQLYIKSLKYFQNIENSSSTYIINKQRIIDRYKFYFQSKVLLILCESL